MKKNTNSGYINYEDAKLKLEKFCIYQDRCHYDVEKKLKSLHVDEDTYNQILINLIQDNFLNEERFVFSFVRGKFNQKKWGKNKIKFELKKRAIHDSLITKALNQIDPEDYFNTLKDLFLKKQLLTKETNPFLKNKKVISYLINRGYEYTLIKEVMEQYNY